jgi:uncharacterized membrane protein YfcA
MPHCAGRPPPASLPPMPEHLPLLIATFLLAGLVKGVTGLGLPTIGIGLLGLAMPPAQAAAVLVVPSLVTNIWQMAEGPALGPLLRRLWPMMAGIALGSWLGAGLLGLPWAPAALGAVLMAYGALGLSPVRLPQATPRAEAWLGPLVGLATGLVTAATGVFVLPAVPWLQMLGLERDALVQALGLSFTVSTLALAAGLSGALTDGAGWLALLPALLGLVLGGRLRRTIPQPLFRRCFFAGLLALGAGMLARTLG